MFSFYPGLTGQRIAKIKGGKRNDQIVYLHNNDEQEEELIKKLIRELLYPDKVYLIECLQDQKRPIRKSKVRDIYDLLQKEIHKNESFNNLHITDGKIQLIPGEKRESFYIAGRNGSGKSTYISHYLQEFTKLYPDSKIYLFSEKDHDDALDKYNVLRIPLDDDLIDDPIDIIDEVDTGDLIIFDDVDSLANKDIKKTVTDLYNKILKVGREKKIHCMVTSHMLFDYIRTRDLLNECSYIVFYPNGTGKNHIKRLLENILGYDKQDIENIKKLFTSRYITVHQNYPNFIVSDHDIILNINNPENN